MKQSHLLHHTFIAALVASALLLPSIAHSAAPPTIADPIGGPQPTSPPVCKAKPSGFAVQCKIEPNPCDGGAIRDPGECAADTNHAGNPGVMVQKFMIMAATTRYKVVSAECSGITGTLNVYGCVCEHGGPINPWCSGPCKSSGVIASVDIDTSTYTALADCGVSSQQ